MTRYVFLLAGLLFVFAAPATADTTLKTKQSGVKAKLHYNVLGLEFVEELGEAEDVSFESPVGLNGSAYRLELEKGETTKDVLVQLSNMDWGNFLLVAGVGVGGGLANVLIWSAVGALAGIAGPLAPALVVIGGLGVLFGATVAVAVPIYAYLASFRGPQEIVVDFDLEEVTTSGEQPDGASFSRRGPAPSPTNQMAMSY